MHTQSDSIRDVGPLAAITEVLARNWWTIALRGVVAIIFGVLAWVMPGITLAALVLLYGSYALVDGVFNVFAALSRRSGARPWWTMLLAGLVSIAAGLVTFFWPGLTAIALVYVIAAWAMVRGVFEIAAAVRLRKVITSEWWRAVLLASLPPRRLTALTSSGPPAPESPTRFRASCPGSPHGAVLPSRMGSGA